MNKNTLRRTLVAVAAGAALAFTGTAWAAQAEADADPGIGCETIRWGFLGSQRRTVCDGPTRPDGSWTRARVVWTPAHYVPVSCYSGRYSSSCSGGYHVDQTVQAQESYVVFPSNVLPDEPGWLPPGTDVIR